MNILDTIVAQKRKEVQERKTVKPIAVLEKEIYFTRHTFSLADVLANRSGTGIIAEFKRKSPSKGVINANSTVEEVTRAYAQFAAGISVLTDTDFLVELLKIFIMPALTRCPFCEKILWLIHTRYMNPKRWEQM